MLGSLKFPFFGFDPVADVGIESRARNQCLYKSADPASLSFIQVQLASCIVHCNCLSAPCTRALPPPSICTACMFMAYGHDCILAQGGVFEKFAWQQWSLQYIFVCPAFHPACHAEWASCTAPLGQQQQQSSQYSQPRPGGSRPFVYHSSS